jgi:hypothetical protein
MSYILTLFKSCRYLPYHRAYRAKGKRNQLGTLGPCRISVKQFGFIRTTPTNMLSILSRLFFIFLKQKLKSNMCAI